MGYDFLRTMGLVTWGTVLREIHQHDAAPIIGHTFENEATGMSLRNRRLAEAESTTQAIDSQSSLSFSSSIQIWDYFPNKIAWQVERQTILLARTTAELSFRHISFRWASWCWAITAHYSDVIMSTMMSQITGVSVVCSTVCWGAVIIK